MKVPRPERVDAEMGMLAQRQEASMTDKTQPNREERRRQQFRPKDTSNDERKPLRKANGMPFMLPFSPGTTRWRRLRRSARWARKPLCETPVACSICHIRSAINYRS